jgi:hypothetical protein
MITFLETYLVLVLVKYAGIKSEAGKTERRITSHLTPRLLQLGELFLFLVIKIHNYYALRFLLQSLRVFVLPLPSPLTDIPVAFLVIFTLIIPRARLTVAPITTTLPLAALCCIRIKVFVILFIVILLIQPTSYARL